MRLRLAKAQSVGHSQLRSLAAGWHRLPPSAEREVPAADVDDTQEDNTARMSLPPAGGRWKRVIAYRLLPALTVILGAGAGYLTWVVVSAHLIGSARVDVVRAAQDGTMAMLTYGPDTADHDLSAARERLTGRFKNTYTLFTHQEVIPSARQKHITSVVNVPAVASVSVTMDHAVVMLFVNQTFMRDSDPPTSTASSVRV
ncbi:MAG: hypothetical protein ACRDTV_14760, partial [Mycobacterium sp.]